jgi:hypothetical protein
MIQSLYDGNTFLRAEGIQQIISPLFSNIYIKRRSETDVVPCT